MTNQEAIEILTEVSNNVINNRIVVALDMAINTLTTIEDIKQIIDIDNSVIQEDVMKYKMICEVIEKEQKNN